MKVSEAFAFYAMHELSCILAAAVAADPGMDGHVSYVFADDLDKFDLEGRPGRIMRVSVEYVDEHEADEW